MYFGFWALIGALIGVVASQRRGINIAGAIIVGFLLGPIAFILFFASGDRKKCPECAEWIKKEAKLCAFCKTTFSANSHSDLTLSEMKKRGIIK